MSARGETRMLELLSDQAIWGLSHEERAELDHLADGFPDLDPETFELAAAAVALCGPRLAPPTDLRARVVDAWTKRDARAGEPAPGSNVVELRRLGRTFSGLGWLAAATYLVLAVIAWWPRAPRMDASPKALTAAEIRRSILARPGTVVVPWTTPDGAAGSGGDVVWNDELQTGFMRIAGLPKNDPSVAEYQLWIFDTTQDERTPIDGGVFDVANDDGEVLVPIDAKLRVRDPKLFAVTVEKPGGVVVSKREKIVLVAKVA